MMIKYYDHVFPTPDEIYQIALSEASSGNQMLMQGGGSAHSAHSAGYGGGAGVAPPGMGGGYSSPHHNAPPFFGSGMYHIPCVLSFFLCVFFHITMVC